MTRIGPFCVSTLVAFLVFVLPSTIIAVGASKDELRPVIDWVKAEGKPSKIDGTIALALGIRIPNEADLPMIHKAYRMESGFVYAFDLAIVDGRREVILERYHQQTVVYRGWRISEEGKVIRTAAIESTEKITKHEGLLFEKEFAEVLDFFVATAAAAKSK